MTIYIGSLQSPYLLLAGTTSDATAEIWWRNVDGVQVVDLDAPQATGHGDGFAAGPAISPTQGWCYDPVDDVVWFKNASNFGKVLSSSPYTVTQVANWISSTYNMWCGSNGHLWYRDGTDVKRIDKTNPGSGTTLETRAMGAGIVHAEIIGTTVYGVSASDKVLRKFASGGSLETFTLTANRNLRYMLYDAGRNSLWLAADGAGSGATQILEWSLSSETVVQTIALTGNPATGGILSAYPMVLVDGTLIVFDKFSTTDYLIYEIVTATGAVTSTNWASLEVDTYAVTAHANGYLYGVAYETVTGDYSEGVWRALAPSSSGGGYQGPTYVRLGSVPTFDVGVASAQMAINGQTDWDAISLIEAAGIGAAYIQTTGWGADGPYKINGFFRGSDTYLDALSEGALKRQSVFWFDREGKFKVTSDDNSFGPVGDATLTVSDESILGYRRMMPSGVPRPPWRVTVKAGERFMYGSQAAASADWSWANVQYLETTTVEDAFRRAYYGEGPELEYKIQDDADTLTIAQNFMEAFNPDRHLLVVDVPLDAPYNAVRIMDIVSVKLPHFNQAGGAKYQVIGTSIDTRRGICSWTLWGGDNKFETKFDSWSWAADTAFDADVLPGFAWDAGPTWDAPVLTTFNWSAAPAFIVRDYWYYERPLHLYTPSIQSLDYIPTNHGRISNSGDAWLGIPSDNNDMDAFAEFRGTCVDLSTNIGTRWDCDAEADFEVA